MGKNSQVQTARRLLAFVRIIRPPNCLMIGFGVIVGEIIALHGGLNPWLAALGYFAGFLLLAASMVINDLFDLETDRINNPARPIPSGIISKNEAKTYAAALSVVGLSFALAINPPSFMVALLAMVSMLAYNAGLKRTGLPGNAIVSANIAVPFIFGGFAVNVLDPSLLVFALLAFLSGLGREITKGIADVRGDKERGVGTVAVRRGEKTAAYLAAALYLTAVILSSLPILYSLVSILYVPFVLICDVGFASSALSILRNPTADNGRRVKTEVLVWMLLGLFAFLAGAFPAPV